MVDALSRCSVVLFERLLEKGMEGRSTDRTGPRHSWQGLGFSAPEGAAGLLQWNFNTLRTSIRLKEASLLHPMFPVRSADVCLSGTCVKD